MNIDPSSLPVADYCNAYDRGEIRINKNYQRSEKVWPDAARSYLIETILLGFPIPKFYLHQITDIRSRQTVKDIVDGQQRSMTIFAFFHNELRLTTTIETEDAAGRTYDELSEELRRSFLEYSIDYDLFTQATDLDVRTVFQRMNSYTFPLNPEEQRHALFQGPFKWFINRLSGEYSEALHEMGVFTQKQLVRMQDAKLLTEIAHALVNGIRTTNKKLLEALYKSRDVAFPEERAFGARFEFALDQIIAWTQIHGTDLMRPYQVYALVLAVMHVHEEIPTLQDLVESPNLVDFPASAVANLLALADAIENPDANADFQEFIEASAKGTNVGAARQTRFEWFCRALTDGF